jgi:hypothetical protein
VVKREDFLPYAQRKKETLPNFYRSSCSSRLKPQKYDNHVIAHAIKALWAGPLHSHLVRERPKTVPELYEQFAKSRKLEIQHIRKLE